MIRLVQITCDWKDEIDGAEVYKAVQWVDGAWIYAYDQDNVDSKIVYICSSSLTSEQLDLLWQAGDLATSDRSWECEDFEQLIKALAEYAASQR